MRFYSKNAWSLVGLLPVGLSEAHDWPELLKPVAGHCHNKPDICNCMTP